MAQSKSDNDLIPGAPWAANFALKAGTSLSLLFLLGYVMVRQSDAVNELPSIAKEIRTTAEESSRFMTDFTTNATNERSQNRDQIITRLAELDTRMLAIEAAIVGVRQEQQNIRLDQQKGFSAFLDALQRILDNHTHPGQSKNLPTGPDARSPPISSSSESSS